MKDGWLYKKLPEISENLDSLRKPVTKKNRTAGIYPYYGASGIVDYVDDFLFDEDLLCISEDGANLLMRTYPIAFPISGKVWVNNHAHVLRFKNMITQRYVEYFFAGIRLDDFITGAAQPKLTQKALNNIIIKMPESVGEQQSIVDYLDSAFAKIDAMKANAEKALNEAKALFQTSLKEMLEPKEGWKTSKIGELCTLKSGNSAANVTPDGELPFVKVSDMNIAGNEDCITCSSRYVNYEQNRKGIFPIGSIIFPKRGGAILTNKKRITAVETCCDLNIMGVFSKGDITSEFLYYFFQGINLADLYNGAAIPQINNSDIAPLTINYPVIDKQKEVVKNLDNFRSNCKKLQANYDKIIQECDALKQAILRQVFEKL